MKNRTAPFQNYLTNRVIDPASCGMRQTGGWVCATDEAGLIVDQRLLDRYRMARVPSGQHGCGWVACYNALRLLGRPEPAARVIRQLERAFVLGGHRGTSAAGLAYYFTQKGFHLKCSLTDAAVDKTAPTAQANIIFYIRSPRRGAHFVAFSPAGTDANHRPLYRFYNSCSVPASPRAPLPGGSGSCFCAGGSAGDVRTLGDLLAPEKPMFFLVFSIF